MAATNDKNVFTSVCRAVGSQHIWDAVRDEVALEVVEDAADAGADDDDRQAELRVEVFADVEVAARAHRAGFALG